MQFDAHIDTWDEYFGGKYFHGTPFRRAIEEGLIDGKRFIQVGIRGPMYGEDDFDFHREHGITMIDIDQVKARGIAWTVEQIRRVVTGPAYMTFDIDSVDPAFAPGTGTPEVGGLTSHEAQQLVRGLAGLTLVGGDIVEVAPPFDGPGQITALLAANLMFEFLCVLERWLMAKPDAYRPWSVPQPYAALSHAGYYCRMRRIVCLGDSLTSGHGIGTAAAFPAAAAPASAPRRISL